MRAADTNVLVRVLARDDEKQVRAAEEFIGRGAWVSHLVLAEAVWVLATAYGFTREDIETAVSML
ncbi:MAG TPA: PIN domain-containing protein, partial [Thermoanaerobaculia bacterium]